MDTAPLKSFATSARTELIREVGARITAVLAQGSPERVEQPRAVTALQRAISAAGGSDKGKVHVADKVAYVWFNRIIALRFMDANGYTGIGVVSPPADQVGQPEVLAAAKRGQLDKNVAKGANLATITGLLNGTRQPRTGVDAQAEAYALLLADYCRHWNKAMPFMFEREGDFTELLIPANLLADDSVLNRSVKVLTEAVCKDVEAIGWLYQFYIADRKDEVFAGFKNNKKAGADEIPAATQLFTPHWIVRYLVENSLGRLWMLNHPSSGLASQMDYYIAPVDEEIDFLKISRPEELKVIDPACGSGHMLTYAFDLLYAIYEEQGYAPSEIPGLILANNLYGTEIDPRAGALAAFALTMKAVAKRKLFLKNPVEPNVCVIEPISFTADELSYLVTRDGDRHAEEAFWNQFDNADTLGSLIAPDATLIVRLASHLETLDDGGDIYRADAIDWAHKAMVQAVYLLPRYSVAIANPPYMGGRNMGPALARFVRERYPEDRQDLYTCFVSRCASLARVGGLVGIVTGDTWLTIRSFEDFRSKLLTERSPISMIHLRDVTNHPDVFGANTAFIYGVRHVAQRHAIFISLTPNGSEPKRRRLEDALAGRAPELVFEVAADEFELVPGAPLAYRMSADTRRSFASSPPVSSVGNPRVGMQTANNERYLRYWWEVGASDIADSDVGGLKWLRYLKGGAFRKWWGNAQHVVYYGENGSAILSEPNGTMISLDRAFATKLEWTDISSGAFSLRLAPPVSMHDIKGHCFYPQDEDAEWLLAYGNSSVFAAYVGYLSPGVNFQVGDVGRVPLLDVDRLELAAKAAVAVEIARRDWDSQETSTGFSAPEVIGQGTLLARAIRDTAESWGDAARSLELAENSIDTAVLTAAPSGLGVHASAAKSSVLIRDYRANMAAGDQPIVGDLVSFAVGCMFGRYSLDEPGLILADQGATLQDYLANVPTPTFTPDPDNLIPIVDGDWFEDDIAERFRQFLRVAFGEEHFEQNLWFVTKSLGVKNLRDYFVKSFYKDHVQRYKKRPIYWLFSSPKGSFNALIYLHRYTPSTVSTVLTYLREYVTKLESALQQAERTGNAKEADRLRKILVELNEYEHDTLFPKASENVVIDLDDGVKANYPKFGAALKKIVGLEASVD